MDNLSKYLDKDGYPGTLQYDGTWDGGDTAAILGTLWFFGEFDDFDQGIPLPWLHSAQVPIRHPDSTKWYGQSDRFSRDQLIAVLAGISAQDQMGFRLGDACILVKAHKRRFFLTAWNTRKNGAMDAPKKWPDFTGPEVWALWLRIFKPRWARFILPVLDLELLLSAIHWRWFRKDRVTRNHMLNLLTARAVMPTIISKLANWLTNFEDLINRWNDHSIAVGEYPTAHLFREYINNKLK